MYPRSNRIFPCPQLSPWSTPITSHQVGSNCHLPNLPLSLALPESILNTAASRALYQILNLSAPTLMVTLPPDLCPNVTFFVRTLLIPEKSP